MSPQQYQEARQEIHWDIAWQVFDEVNEYNDVEKFIDLNCIEVEEAIAICKQKLFDVAQQVRKQYQGQDQVLNILCSELHMENVIDEYDGMQKIQNQILDMVQNELKLDFNYQSSSKNILVRVG